MLALKRIPAGKVSEETITSMTDELLLMYEVRHLNVVQFMASCYTPEVAIVMEYLERGSLDRVLRDPTVEPDMSWSGTKMRMALDVARGMAYL